MTFTLSRLDRGDGRSIAVYSWPAPTVSVKAVVQLHHGMGEHAGRYDRFALELSRAGYQVYASDHLGHGQTAPTRSDLGYFGEQDTGSWTKLLDDMHALNRQIA